MPQADPRPAKLLEDFFPLLDTTVADNGVLDLACGSGRNGLFLARHNLPVVFADINSAALKKIFGELAGLNTGAQFWEVDFEDPESRPLAGKEYDAILVFNYLHRPLIPYLRQSLVAGGLLLYETFTVAQATLGRPSNPEYLLKPGELRSWFEDWEILHYFEGDEGSQSGQGGQGGQGGKGNEGDDDKPKRYYANLVARKPAGRD